MLAFRPVRPLVDHSFDTRGTPASCRRSAQDGWSKKKGDHLHQKEACTPNLLVPWQLCRTQGSAREAGAQLWDSSQKSSRARPGSGVMPRQAALAKEFRQVQCAMHELNGHRAADNRSVKARSVVLSR